MSSLVYLVVHFKPHTCFLTALFFALKRELVVFRQEKHKTYYLSQNFTLPRQENSTLVLPCIFLFDPFYAKKGYSHGFNVLLEIHISKFSHNEDPVSLKWYVIMHLNIFHFFLQLFAYDTVNKNLSPKPGEQPKLPIPASLIAGACAGVSSTICTYPLELLKTRLTIQVCTYKSKQTLVYALV